MENNASREIIVVKQLPVIEEQLPTIKATIQERVGRVLAMECTEETYKLVKAERAALNKEFKALEDRRKEVKEKVEAPYKAFEKVYKECAGDIYADADRKLAEKIGAVENGLRKQMADQTAVFFSEYRESLNIPADLADMESAGIRVTLSASLKSLKMQAKAYLDRLKDDLTLIDEFPNRDEVLAEYRLCRNVAQAQARVKDRHEQIENERRRREEARARMQAAAEQTARAAAAIEAAEPEQLCIPEAQDARDEDFPEEASSDMPEENAENPAVSQPENANENAPRYSVSFRVTGTLEQLKAMKRFLIDGGYDYAQL